MKVYEQKGFPNPTRIRIALAEKGVTNKVQFIPVDVLNGEHRKPEFLAKNPSGFVPVMELDDGTILTECTAITEYIDRAFEGPRLGGATAVQHAKVHMMQRRAESNLLDAIGAYFHHATPGLGPVLEPYQNKEWGEKQLDRAIEGMGYFDSVFGKSAFAAGSEFSMADITVFAGLLFARFVKLDVPSAYKNLQAWCSKMEQRPSVAAALAG